MMFVKKLLKVFAAIAISKMIFGQSSEVKPTAILQAVCWDRFASKNLSYFPWGNDRDENATNLDLNIGFSSPTLPFVYYGESPIKFFVKEMDRDLPKEETEQSIFNQVGEFDFTSRNGNPARYLLLFLTQQGKSKVKIFSISLKQESLPYGTFNCYSQFKENLYLAYGNQKQSLAPGKSVRFKQNESTTNSSEIKIFRRENGDYIEEITEYIKVNEGSRGIVFLSPNRKRLKMKRYYLNQTPPESMIGYGIEATIAVERGKYESNSTSVVNPIQN